MATTNDVAQTNTLSTKDQASELESNEASDSAPAESISPDIISDEQDGFALTRKKTIKDGDILAITISTPTECNQTAGKWLGRWFALWGKNKRWQALLPVPLRTNGDLTLRFYCDHKRIEFNILVNEGKYPETQLTVDPKYSSKPPARAVYEQKEIAKAYERGAKSLLWHEPFLRPTAGVETSLFGVRRIFNGKIASRHFGLDYDGKVGVAVFAANDGIVVLAAHDFYFTGNCIFIDHGSDLFTSYFHLDRLDVVAGQRVTKGQQIGVIGATGRATGPHLHFGVKLLGHYVNPKELLKIDPDTTIDAYLDN
ncbi:MAG: M23 family metallopeptidase [Deltaproteobacteria bacterium]|nr:M23 family metallopeptidase [Deltaproteobacteria bacterium]